MKKQMPSIRLILPLLFLLACQGNRVPRHVLEPEIMVPMLADFHKVYALQNTSEYRTIAREYDSVDLYGKIYAKYGVDKASFDTSVAWYVRHPELYVEIYDRVVMQLNQETDALRDQEEMLEEEEP